MHTTTIDPLHFERLVAPHRPELLAHCYRMLGSAQDAEDALQEALTRAWRGLAGFEGRSSMRTWLHRIATNVCLRAIERRPRRLALPAGRGDPDDPLAPPRAPATEVAWLEPFPDAAAGLGEGRASPEARYEQREAVELAFTAALQHLPARQRAVLLLRDVLGFAPAEIAEALGTSPAAVSSALQRARQAAEERMPARSQQATLRAIGDRRLREAVERYVRAWERGDVAALVAMLAEDVTFSMPPSPSWYRGREVVGAFVAAHPLAPGRRWRIVPLLANAQLAFAFYLQDADGTFQAWAIDVCDLDEAGRLTSLVAFHDPGAFGAFGLAPRLPDRRADRWIGRPVRI